MKKLLLILSSCTLMTVAFAQGTVSFLNGSYALISTNITSAALTATAPNGFYYGLFTAPSTVTAATTADLLTPIWTFTGNYATNIAAAGRLSGGNGVATLTGWAPGATNSFLVAGWNAVMGHDWSTINSELSHGTWPPYSLFGISAVGFGAAGGGTAGMPAFALWGLSPTTQGTPLSAGFVLGLPEPSAFALLAIAAVTFACRQFRKRNRP
jgi:hypothetical protein